MPIYGPGLHPVRRVALLREPLLWAALAAFVGTAVGLIGTFRYAGMVASLDFTLFGVIFANAAQFLGEALAALSLLGVPALLGYGSRRVGMRAAVIGGVLLSVLILSSATTFVYLWYVSTGDRVGTPYPFSRFAEVCLWVSVFAPPAIVVPFVVATLWARRLLLGALVGGLCLFCFPLGVIWFYFHPEGMVPSAAPWLLGFMGTGVGLPEAPLWVLLGFMLWRVARERALSKVWHLEAEENREKALRLYEQGLGGYDLSVVDELVSEGFHDLRTGSSGRLGMERVITALWRSYPDLSVSVEAQEAERDLVKTRLLLSGTDHGGVMWYPPTHRPVAFSAEFADRFVEGELVEHTGEADTEELLRQLGHRRGDGPGPRQTLGDGSRS